MKSSNSRRNSEHMPTAKAKHMAASTDGKHAKGGHVHEAGKIHRGSPDGGEGIVGSSQVVVAPKGNSFGL